MLAHNVCPLSLLTAANNLTEVEVAGPTPASWPLGSTANFLADTNDEGKSFSTQFI